MPCEVYTVAPHVTTCHRLMSPFGPQSFSSFQDMSMHSRISVMFMLRPALPASFLAKIGAAGYTASAARWAVSLALGSSRGQAMPGPISKYPLVNVYIAIENDHC